MGPTAAERVRGDSLVAETSFHWTRESCLVLGVLTKILLLAPAFAKALGVTGWLLHKSL